MTTNMPSRSTGRSNRWDRIKSLGEFLEVHFIDDHTETYRRPSLRSQESLIAEARRARLHREERHMTAEVLCTEGECSAALFRATNEEAY